MSVSAPSSTSGLRRSRLCVVSGALLGGLALAGCSAESSRFDYPAFAMAQQAPDTQRARDAQPMTTASLPPAVPREPVYGNGAPRPQARQQAGYADTVERRPVPARDADRRQAPRVVAARPAAPQGPPQADTRHQPAPQAGRNAYDQAAAPRPEPMPQPVQEPSRSAGAEITVAQGDTLSAISRRHNVSVDALMRANNLSNSRLREGQRLVLPGDSAPARPTATASATHKVQSGESLYGIARRYNASHEDIARANNLDGTLIQPGQALRIPGGDASAVASRSATPQSPSGVRVVRTRAVQVPDRSEEQPVRVAATGPVPVPQSSPERDQAETSAQGEREQEPERTRLAALPPPTAMTGTEFRWPVRGRIVSGFGPKEDGRHNDGINIAVPLGTAVKAAENGVVAYSGNELEGYGNLVLIRHDDDWVSAYAHNDELLVQRGDSVQRGQDIARVGQSGSVSQPQLHFELRRGSKPVDPLPHLAQN